MAVNYNWCHKQHPTQADLESLSESVGDAKKYGYGILSDISFTVVMKDTEFHYIIGW